MISRALLIVMISGVLLGCSERQSDTSNKVISQSDFSARYVSVVLPSGVNITFPFELTSERLYTREDSGETRRGLMLEFVDIEPTRVAEELKLAFSEAGYRARGTDVASSNDRTSLTLLKRGSPTIFVDIQPTGHRSLKTPNALGTVWLSWRVRDGSLDQRTTEEE